MDRRVRKSVQKIEIEYGPYWRRPVFSTVVGAGL